MFDHRSPNFFRNAAIGQAALASAALGSLGKGSNYSAMLRDIQDNAVAPISKGVRDYFYPSPAPQTKVEVEIEPSGKSVLRPIRRFRTADVPTSGGTANPGGTDENDPDPSRAGRPVPPPPRISDPQNPDPNVKGASFTEVVPENWRYSGPPDGTRTVGVPVQARGLMLNAGFMDQGNNWWYRPSDNSWVFADAAYFRDPNGSEREAIRQGHPVSFYPGEFPLTSRPMLNPASFRKKVKSVPKPPLIGVETNPGPGKNRKGGVVSGPSVRRRNNRRRVQNNSGSMMAAVPAARAFIHTPRTMFSSTNFRGKNGLRVSGHQRMAILYIYSNAPSFASGSSSKDLAVRPAAFSSPIAALANCFIRYKFKKLSISYSPAVSTGVSGNVLLGYTSDVYSNTGTINDSTISSLANSIEAPLWSTFTLNTKLDPQLDLLYCKSTGSDSRYVYQGDFLLGGTYVGTNGTVIGDLWIDYELELFELGYSPDIGLFVHRDNSVSVRNVEEEKKVDSQPTSLTSSPVLV
jgi:hypothetical protein